MTRPYAHGQASPHRGPRAAHPCLAVAALAGLVLLPAAAHAEELADPRSRMRPAPATARDWRQVPSASRAPAAPGSPWAPAPRGQPSAALPARHELGTAGVRSQPPAPGAAAPARALTAAGLPWASTGPAGTATSSPLASPRTSLPASPGVRPIATPLPARTLGSLSSPRVPERYADNPRLSSREDSAWPATTTPRGAGDRGTTDGGLTLRAATPRAALPRTVTPAAPVTQAAGLRQYAGAATPRVAPAPAPATLPRSTGTARSLGASSLHSAATGVHHAGTRSGALPSPGAGVRYGGYGSLPPAAIHHHGSAWRQLYVRPAPRYLDPCLPVTVVHGWGFATCECAPVIVAPPPVIVLPPPLVLPPPVIVVPAPVLMPPPAPEHVTPAPMLPPAEPQAPLPAAPEAPPQQSAPATPPSAPEPWPAPAPAPPDEEAPLTLSPEDQQALAQSLQSFAAGEYAAALAPLEALAARVPALGQAWLGIAHASFALGRIERAAQAVTQAAVLGAFPRGYAFDPRGLYPTPAAFEERLAALTQRAAAEPSQADLRLVLAWLQMSLGQRHEARAGLDALLVLRPGDEAAPLLALALLPPLPPPAEAPATGTGLEPSAPPPGPGPTAPPVR